MQRSTTLKRQLSSPELEPAKDMRSTLILQPKAGSPLLILSTEKDGCRLCNPADERVVYETKSDLSGHRFLGSSGDNKEDYVVVWHFEMNEFLGFCKKGDDHYREISTMTGVVRRELHGVKDMVLKGYSLYVLAIRDFIRHLDLSGHGEDGIKDVSENHKLPMWKPGMSRDEHERVNIYKITSSSESIAVTRSGQVLVVYSYELGNSQRHRMFHVYKRDPKDLDPTTYLTHLLEVHSLGDEALFLDLGTTVPADHTLGIEPNSIYFTRGDRIRHRNPSRPDICVFSLTTKTIKRFPTLSSFNVKDAQWFLPS
ncbi:unnamed protein product [Arabidopsis arenosa]|uniref:KIB1-4 beta-propeller domain-containing protein n=1 Tax=Arabidopsis arenosa TaxID=38785 RepID=A0A8S1ZFV4_ARAAE|nr:unnamed protein product [Arabidopsis arenosa]